jgi:ubiquinol-cytochrome c reductase core subunit 2
MLAARASSTARTVSRLRNFATVVDVAGGYKVSAIDNGQPTSAVTFLVKAGSRYESKPGVAHALKNFAFKVRIIARFLFIVLLFRLWC